MPIGVDAFETFNYTLFLSSCGAVWKKNNLGFFTCFSANLSYILSNIGYYLGYFLYIYIGQICGLNWPKNMKKNLTYFFPKGEGRRLEKNNN